MPDHAISPAKPKRKVAIIATVIIVVGIAIAGVSYLLARQWTTQNREVAEQSQPEINRYSQLSDIQFDDDKINFYVFWGDGCIHCEHLFAYLDEIWSDYSQYFNLYAFEIWSNEDNDKVMDYFMEQIGLYVPFTGAERSETMYFRRFASVAENEMTYFPCFLAVGRRKFIWQDVQI